MRQSNKRPVHIKSGAGPRVARQMPKMHRMWPIFRRELYMLCAQRQSLLQARLFQVSGELLFFFLHSKLEGKKKKRIINSRYIHSKAIQML